MVSIDKGTNGCKFYSKAAINIRQKMDRFCFMKDYEVEDRYSLKKIPFIKIEKDVTRHFIYRGEKNQNTGVLQGRGISIHENGDIYEGHYKNGVPHGHCRKYDYRGYCIEGYFTDGFEVDDNIVYTFTFSNSPQIGKGYYKFSGKVLVGSISQLNGDVAFFGQFECKTTPLAFGPIMKVFDNLSTSFSLYLDGEEMEPIEERIFWQHFNLPDEVLEFKYFQIYCQLKDLTREGVFDEDELDGAVEKLAYYKIFYPKYHDQLENELNDIRSRIPEQA